MVARTFGNLKITDTACCFKLALDLMGPIHAFLIVTLVLWCFWGHFNASSLNHHTYESLSKRPIEGRPEPRKHKIIIIINNWLFIPICHVCLSACLKTSNKKKSSTQTRSRFANCWFKTLLIKVTYIAFKVSNLSFLAFSVNQTHISLTLTSHC